MAVKTKSIYGPAEPGDGERVLVTRFYPRGVARSSFDVWARDLAPSAPLLRRYRGGGVEWGAFAELYKGELRANPDGLRVAESLRARSEASDVTLLCYEPDGAPCHRHLLRAILRDPRLLRADFEPSFQD